MWEMWGGVGDVGRYDLACSSLSMPSVQQTSRSSFLMSLTWFGFGLGLGLGFGSGLGFLSRSPCPRSA